MCLFFFFKQKTAYEIRISDWSSDVCSSDLGPRVSSGYREPQSIEAPQATPILLPTIKPCGNTCMHAGRHILRRNVSPQGCRSLRLPWPHACPDDSDPGARQLTSDALPCRSAAPPRGVGAACRDPRLLARVRSEEPTSELQS